MTQDTPDRSCDTGHTGHSPVLVPVAVLPPQRSVWLLRARCGRRNKRTTVSETSSENSNIACATCCVEHTSCCAQANQPRPTNIPAGTVTACKRYWHDWYTLAYIGKYAKSGHAWWRGGAGGWARPWRWRCAGAAPPAGPGPWQLSGSRPPPPPPPPRDPPGPVRTRARGGITSQASLSDQFCACRLGQALGWRDDV